MNGRRPCGQHTTLICVALALFTLTTSANAIEMADGRIQAHGFAEMQIRGISRNFSEDLNLTQFYNILNLELEFDIAPDGVGPFDLISAFVRLEGRYDCVYSSGCGLSPNTRTYGDKSDNLPPRLADAEDRDFAGVIDLNDVQPFLDPNDRPNTVAEVFVEERDSGRTTGLLASNGADPLLAHLTATGLDGTQAVDPTDPDDGSFVNLDDPLDDDPGRYTLDAVLDFAFAAKFQKGNAAGGTALLAPWLPKNFITDSALLIDRANPYRGRVAPVIAGRAQRTRFYEGDIDEAFKNGDIIPTNPIDPAPGFQGTYVPTYCTNDQIAKDTCLGDGESRGQDPTDPNPRTAQVFNLIELTDAVVTRHQNILYAQFLDDFVTPDPDERGTYDPDFVDVENDTFMVFEEVDRQPVLVPHGYADGQPVRASQSTRPDARLPGGLEDDRDYFAIVISETEFSVSEVPGGEPVPITDAGAGDNFWRAPPVTNPTTSQANISLDDLRFPNGGPFPADEVFLVTTSRPPDDPRGTPPDERKFFVKTSAFYVHEDDPRLQVDGELVKPGDPFPINDATVIAVQPIIPIFKTIGNEGFGGAGNEGFGGDLSNIIPGQPPEGRPTETANPDSANCHPGGTGYSGIKDAGRCPDGATLDGRSVSTQGVVDATQVPSRDNGNSGVYPFTNRRINGGAGELPLRPAADLSFRDTDANPGIRDAQGVYYPSAGFRQALATTDFDNPHFNISELDRSFNRGSSQSDNKELKEAYLDVEMIESRLYMRLGLQNIVWGKTELFRTTDQFNPTDLALSSLPSLEEARVALWAAKFIYSFYDVGPLEDVRVEFAMNLDDYEPTDLGGCGEPYTLDVICGLTFGIAAHGFVGLGVAGFDRPPAFWEDGSGLEFGARVEWRWDRFSFALINFYGYDDFPSADPIFYFERNADLTTGRPLVTRFEGGNAGAQHSFDPNLDDKGLPLFGKTGCDRPGRDPVTGSSTSPVLVGVLGPDALGNPNPIVVDLPFDSPKNPFSSSPRGLGIDEPCLKAGGLPGFQATNPGPDGFYFDPEDPDADSNGDGVPDGADDGADNALTYHPANQQFHAFACSATTGIIGLDRTQCALAIFGSPNSLDPSAAPYPLSEFFAAVFAGEPQTNAVIQVLTNQSRGGDSGSNPNVTAPFAQLNRDRGPICDNNTSDPDANQACNQALRNAGWDGIITASGFNINRPDPSLGVVRYIDPDGQEATRDCGRQLPGINDTNLGPCRADSFFYQPEDWLTLDSVLTNQQKALLGCGPFFGTRCDSADGVPEFRDRGDGVLVEQDVPLIPAGGGLDLLNADASFLFQSWVGVEGTGPDNWTPRLVAAFEAAERERIDTHPGGFQTGLVVDCVNPDTPTRDICQAEGKNLGFAPDEETTVTITNRDPLGNPVGEPFQITGLAPARWLDPMFPTWLTTAESLLQPHTFRLGNYDDSALAAANGFEATSQSLGARSDAAQPCTVFNETTGELVVLPGCRGIEAVGKEDDPDSPTGERFVVTFQEGYLPSVDGCIFGDTSPGLDAGNVPLPGDGKLDIGGVPVRVRNAEGRLAQELEACAASDSSFAQQSNTRVNPKDLGQIGQVGIPVRGARSLFHPMAGCLADEDAASLDPFRNVCNWQERDFGLELRGLDPTGNGRGPENVFLFDSEGAAMSYNVQMFFVASSCAGDTQEEILADRDCFDAKDSFSPQRCSFAAPQFCANIKSFLGLSGPRRNVVQAGGTNGRGRRVFLWNSGGEIVLQYDQRNVLGFSMDFAEDVSKTNWNMEFTWVGAETVFDSNSFNGVNTVDALNLTVSVDRPTFINFLNPNRTFFFNSQWFFQYLPGWKDSYTGNGPWNVLFTFAVLAGYFQDRLLPQLVSVYDFQSQSGGLLPQMQYRFTENFSATIGMNLFWGRTQLFDMPVRGVAPNGNRADPNAYKNGGDVLLSNFRARDEIFLRLRWTF